MIASIPDIAVSIRDMAHDDVAQVADIERRSYEFPWSHGVFRDCLLAGYRCTVADRDGTAVGYAILSIAAGEAHILNLCVHPQYRRLGYGQKLLDVMIDQARHADVRQMLLEVRPSNEKAIALYRKKGFRQIASRAAYYQARDGREDAAVFAKTFRK